MNDFDPNENKEASQSQWATAGFGIGAEYGEHSDMADSRKILDNKYLIIKTIGEGRYAK